MYNKEDSDLSFYGKYSTYKIQRGDTLQSVAQELGIKPKELRRYHNMHCKIADLIESDFKRYSKFLILAEEKSEINLGAINEKIPQKVSFGSNYNLLFQPNGISKDYSVEYTFESGNKIDTMEMGVRVHWLSTDINKYHLFEIHKSIHFFIDNDAPDRLMYELESKIAEVIYPLKIVVDAYGNWIDVYNYKEIASRWENKKNKFFDYYEKNAKVTKHIIGFVEGALISSDTLFEALHSDYFLRSLFNGIYISYTSDYGVESDISFPLRKNKEAVFKTEQKINPYLNESGWIEVEQNGNYINSDSENNFEYESYIGKYRAKYYLDSYSSFIEKLSLECHLVYDEPIKISLNIESLKEDEIKKSD